MSGEVAVEGAGPTERKGAWRCRSRQLCAHPLRDAAIAFLSAGVKNRPARTRITLAYEGNNGHMLNDN